MAGFSKAYFFGGAGGFMGSDGLTKPFVAILQGESNRMWFEALYADTEMRPMSALRAVVPAGPEAPTALLDAAIVFLSSLFQDCPSFGEVAAQLEDAEMLDFHLGPVPEKWEDLRREALPIYRTLNLYEAELRPVSTAAQFL